MLHHAIKVVAQSGLGQDRACAYRFEDSNTFVLSDGAGGTTGGDIAADEIIASLNSRYPQEPVVLMDTLLDLDNSILTRSDAGEATCIVVTISGDKVTGAVVGDSSIFEIDDTGMRELSDHKQRKPLLGSGECFPVTFQSTLAKKRFLLCSDGLSNYSKLEEIESAARTTSLEHAVDRLVELPRLKGGQYPDDVAVVLIECAK